MFLARKLLRDSKIFAIPDLPPHQVLLNAEGKPLGPNDWLCPKCNGHNYSRREDCYKCKTAKPGAK